MSEEIIKVLDALAEKFGVTVDWTSTNVIPYLEQICGKYVNYEIATSVIWMLFGIGCLILGRFLFKKMKYYFEKSDSMDDNNVYSIGCVFAGFGFGIAVVIGVIIVMYQISDIAGCLTFPEKIIIDELKSIYASI